MYRHCAQWHYKDTERDCRGPGLVLSHRVRDLGIRGRNWLWASKRICVIFRQSPCYIFADEQIDIDDASPVCRFSRELRS